MTSSTTTTTNSTSSRTILADSDTSWVRVPFLVSFGKTFTKTIEAMRYIADDEDLDEGTIASNWAIDYYSYSCGAKTLSNSGYTDTRLGANDAINCIWQFNRDDDIVYPLTQTGGTTECPIGMGRVYAATTNRNQTIAYLTFGVPLFASIMGFWKRAFDSDAITYNITGGFGLSEVIGSLFTKAVGLAGFALSLPFLPFKWIGDLLSRSKEYRIDRFYDLRTTMHLYYRYVDSILSEWGIAVGFRGDKIQPVPTDHVPLALKYTGTSIFNIMALHAAIMNSERQGLTTSTGVSYEEALKEFSVMEPDEYDDMQREDTGVQTQQKQQTTYPTGLETNASGNTQTTSRTAEAIAGGSGGLRNLSNSTKGPWNNNRVNFLDSLMNEAAGATQFIGFRINKSVDASESFSNSTGPSPLAEMFNNKIKQNMGSVGNEVSQAGTGIGIFDKLVGGAKKILSGAAEFFGAGGLAEAVIGNAFIDVPESYRGSDYSKSHSISLQLRSPYGDISSIYQTIIVPLAMILAMALPRAAGPYSYLSPFLCRVYVKGMFAIPLGIVDSLSIKRGSSEFGWTYQNLPTCIDVTLSIKDLSPLIYMAMSDSTFPDIFGANTSFREYLLTLAGVGLHERISRWRDTMSNIKLAAMNLGRLTNGSFIAHALSDTPLFTAIGSVLPYSLTPNN